MNHFQLREQENEVTLISRNRGLGFLAIGIREALTRLQRPRYALRHYTKSKIGREGQVHVFVPVDRLRLGVFDSLIFYPVAIWLALAGIYFFYVQSAQLFANRPLPEIFARGYHMVLAETFTQFQPTFAHGVALYIYAFGFLFTTASLIGFFLALWLFGHAPTQVLRSLAGPISDRPGN